MAFRVEVTCQARLFAKPKRVAWSDALPVPRVGDQIALPHDETVYRVAVVEWVPHLRRVLVVARGGDMP